MDNINPSDVQNEILEHVSSMTKENRNFPYRNFENYIHTLPQNIPIAILKELATFSSDQLSRWQADWYFSWAHSPNMNAQSEMKNAAVRSGLPSRQKAPGEPGSPERRAPAGLNSLLVRNSFDSTKVNR